METGLKQGMEEGLWQSLKAGMALGGAKFHEKVRGLVKGDRREQPDVRAWERRDGWNRLVQAVEKVKGEKWTQFRDRRNDWGRDLALWIARQRCGLTLRELGAKAGDMAYPAVSKAVERMGRKIETDRFMARTYRKTLRLMSNVQT